MHLGRSDSSKYESLFLPQESSIGILNHLYNYYYLLAAVCLSVFSTSKSKTSSPESKFYLFCWLYTGHHCSRERILQSARDRRGTQLCRLLTIATSRFQCREV